MVDVWGEVMGAAGRERVRARAVVMACWNGVIPYIAPEFPAAQREAMAYGVMMTAKLKELIDSKADEMDVQNFLSQHMTSE